MPAQTAKKLANKLNGKEWLQHSISIWSNLRKSPEELALKHPAMFPASLIGKLLDCFTNENDKVVLDPFVGVGTTVLEAMRRGKEGIGFDISEEFLRIARTRFDQQNLFESDSSSYQLIHDNALRINQHLPNDSVDIVITSPPYWNILNQKRTADGKSIRHYGNLNGDLGAIDDYSEFMSGLHDVFKTLSKVLKLNKYCIVNVMDIRKGPKFYPVHSDLSIMLVNAGYELDDILIWDRSHEYNNLRPLGYPAVFRINRIHEYLLIFKNRRS